MESDIFVDCERIKALGMFASFEKNGDTVTWEHAEPNQEYRFLVIHGRLVIGAVTWHQRVYALWMMRDKPVSFDNEYDLYLAVREKEADNRDWSYPEITAAGIISADGRIIGWKSETYQKTTPKDMRSEIEQEVTRLFRSGALAPR